MTITSALPFSATSVYFSFESGWAGTIDVAEASVLFCGHDDGRFAVPLRNQHRFVLDGIEQGTEPLSGIGDGHLVHVSIIGKINRVWSA
ncbi:MAG: hypothetical protein WA485_11885 [Candidatus Sulfotelmatobacter sp.]